MFHPDGLVPFERIHYQKCTIYEWHNRHPYVFTDILSFHIHYWSQKQGENIWLISSTYSTLKIISECAICIDAILQCSQCLWITKKWTMWSASHTGPGNKWSAITFADMPCCATGYQIYWYCCQQKHFLSFITILHNKTKHSSWAGAGVFQLCRTLSYVLVLLQASRW